MRIDWRVWWLISLKGTYFKNCYLVISLIRPRVAPGFFSNCVVIYNL